MIRYPCNYYYTHHYVDIPRLPSPLTIDSNASSIMVTWLPTKFIPDNYKISYSCWLLCGSFVSRPTVSANVTSSSHIIPADPGSNCSVSITAVFGSNISNTVTNTTITSFAGMYYNNTSLNSYELHCKFPTPCSSY